MFGDPVKNDKKFNTSKLYELCSIGSSKRIYQSELKREGVPFIKISDFDMLYTDGDICTDMYIDETRYQSLLKNDLVPREGDILITSRGTIGKCYIVGENDKFYFQDGMISWLYDIDDKVLNKYIAYSFTMDGIKRQIDDFQAGSTVAYLSISMLKKISIVLPPIELQNQFADFVEQVNKSKFTHCYELLLLIIKKIWYNNYV